MTQADFVDTADDASSVRRTGRTIRPVWPVVLGAVAIGPALGAAITGALWVLDTTTTRIDSSFFSTCAQVGPVFGLALFVEIALVMQQTVAEQGATPGNVATTRALVRANIGLMLTSEGTALYAISSSCESVFLAAMVVTPWLIQLFLMADAVYLRLDVHRIRPG